MTTTQYTVRLTNATNGESLGTFDLMMRDDMVPVIYVTSNGLRVYTSDGVLNLYENELLEGVSEYGPDTIKLGTEIVRPGGSVLLRSSENDFYVYLRYSLMNDRVFPDALPDTFDYEAFVNCKVFSAADGTIVRYPVHFYRNNDKNKKHTTLGFRVEHDVLAASALGGGRWGEKYTVYFDDWEAFCVGKKGGVNGVHIAWNTDLYPSGTSKTLSNPNPIQYIPIQLDEFFKALNCRYFVYECRLTVYSTDGTTQTDVVSFVHKTPYQVTSDGLQNMITGKMVYKYTGTKLFCGFSTSSTDTTVAHAIGDVFEVIGSRNLYAVETDIAEHYIVEKETLQSIANAIRSKSGKEESIAVEDFASEILDLDVSDGIEDIIATDEEIDGAFNH